LSGSRNFAVVKTSVSRLARIVLPLIFNLQ